MEIILIYNGSGFSNRLVTIITRDKLYEAIEKIKQKILEQYLIFTLIPETKIVGFAVTEPVDNFFEIIYKVKNKSGEIMDYKFEAEIKTVNNIDDISIR